MAVFQIELSDGFFDEIDTHRPEGYTWSQILHIANSPTFKKDQSARFNALLTFRDIQNLIGANKIDLAPRFCQRQEVMPPQKRKELVETILEDSAGVPTLTIAICTRDDRMTDSKKKFLVIDGLQRTSTLNSFMNNEFSISHGKWKDLTEEQQDRILDYVIPVIVEVNRTQQELTNIFLKINNGSTPLNGVEKRNAVVGEFTEYVRSLVRGSEDGKTKPHPLFAKNSDKEYKYFAPKETNDRYAMEDFCHKLIRLYLEKKNQSTSGWFVPLTDESLLKWVREHCENGQDWSINSETWKDVKEEFDGVFNYAKQLLSNVDPIDREKMTRNLAIYFIMTNYEYGHSTMGKYRLDFTKDGCKRYANAFFEMYRNWSDPALKIYQFTKDEDGNEVPRYQFSSNSKAKPKPMQPFSELFDGLNGPQYNTYQSIIKENITDDTLQQWGLVAVDRQKGRGFSRSMIEEVWWENRGRCYYTGVPVDKKELVGDHIESYCSGGKTIKENCAPTSNKINQLKGKLTVEEFIPYLHSQGYPIAERFHHLIPFAA